MKTTTTALCAIAALSSCSYAAVTMNIARTAGKSTQTTKLRHRNLSPRASITEALVNNVTGGDYLATVSVGTPAQAITLAIDTGSSDVWLLATTADLCTDPYLQAEYRDGCSETYDHTASSTYRRVERDGFSIQYQDGTGAFGDYISDNLSIGGATVDALQMGLGYNVTLGTGLLGIGYANNEASYTVYPSIIDTLHSQGLIATKAYSLFLDDLDSSTGSIIFGGIDEDKFYGQLVNIPIQPSAHYANGTAYYSSFDVKLKSFSITNSSGSTTVLTTSKFNETALLDSGTTLTYLPDQLVSLIYNYLNAYDDTTGSGLAFVDCNLRDHNPSTRFNYGFPGVNISVPIHELVFDLTGLFSIGEYQLPFDIPFDNVCALGISASGGSNTLGDTFLRSAYVVYDLKNNQVAIAQTNFESNTTKIVDFDASATAIPSLSGVGGSVVLATGTIVQSSTTSGGSHSTTTASGSAVNSGTTTTGAAGGVAAATSTTGKSSAATVPGFDSRVLVVLGMTSILAVVGGGWFIN